MGKIAEPGGTSRFVDAVVLYRKKRFAAYAAFAAALAAALACVAVWRLMTGDVPIPPARVAGILLDLFRQQPETNAAISEIVSVRTIRLPRLLAALGTGAALGTAGVVLQGLLQNPMAEPYTLGVASGAAFGGALAFSASAYLVVPAAFVGALAALLLVSALARLAGGGRTQIVLAGIIVSSFLSAGVSFLKAMADEKLSAIVLWLMGGFSGASPGSALVVWIAATAAFAVSWLYGRHLDAISLGENAGAMLGVDERAVRALLLCAVSLSSAAAVSFFGIIGFVGLVVPHLVRMVAGSTHRPLLFFSFFGGALLMALADGAAQQWHELPVSVVTALVGAPVFCWLLVRRKGANG